MKYITVKDMPEGERPRERLAKSGPQALSTAELLAILLGSGVGGENVLTMAYRLLAEHRGLSGLARLDFALLQAEHGLGPAKSARLLSAFEVGRRLSMELPEDRYEIHNPSDAANLLQSFIGHQEQEHFVVLFLDTRNRIVDKEVLYKGSLNTSLVRIGEVFRGAIRRNCASILVAHNHPSGDPSPSPEDIALTKRLIAAGELLEIQLLDHLVIGHNCFVSMRERALAFD